MIPSVYAGAALARLVLDGTIMKKKAKRLLLSVEKVRALQPDKADAVNGGQLSPPCTITLNGQPCGLTAGGTSCLRSGGLSL
jgi:hypothetical protein